MGNHSPSVLFVGTSARMKPRRVGKALQVPYRACALRRPQVVCQHGHRMGTSGQVRVGLTRGTRVEARMPAIKLNLVE